MIDFSTTYLGFTLKNPLVASSSPLCENIDNLRRMEDAGMAAIAIRKRVDPDKAMMEARRQFIERVAAIFKLGYCVCTQIF